ncbi:ATP-binding protein [Jiella avicenniae]|uniref:ATP-binding protein n=1 Tax=Jiella avicenniae TaxID=2907202 RepID=A0A9X1P157_9HYPH|nr:ATP-binding protein [Jiella avicenniae]MCE7028445.1 ATP-binding protein [Jiella avicenniae]
MAISLSDLRTVRADKPPRVLIYGNEGVGKTTLASEFPNPVFLQAEEGTPGELELSSFGTLPTFGAVMEAMEALYNDEHDFNTVVVDSVTALQRLIFVETCRRGDEYGNAKARIEDFGYGKGYVNAKVVLREFLEGCDLLRRDRGMAIVLIAHSVVTTFNDPETASYDRYEIDLHKQLLGEVTRDLDAILLLKKPVKTEEEKKGFNGTRTRASGAATVVLMHPIGKPAFVAKNRYGMPESLRFDRGKGFEALAGYFPNWTETTATAKAAA